MNTPSGFFTLHVQESLSVIAKKYYEFYSTKCSTTLEESYSVLGLPLESRPPTQQVSGISITHQTGSVAGIPGAGTPVTATGKTKIPVKRGTREPKKKCPHTEFDPKKQPPVEGWCCYVLTKGDRVGKYCIREVNYDEDKGRGKYCKECYRRSEAFGKESGVKAKAKGATSGIAPGADLKSNLTPGAFSTNLPMTGRPTFTLKPLAGSTDMFIQTETDLIFKSMGDIKVVCGARENDKIIPLEDKHIEIAKRMKTPYITQDGTTHYPDELSQDQKNPQEEHKLQSLTSSQPPLPFGATFNPTTVEQKPNIPGIPGMKIPGFDLPSGQSQINIPPFNPLQHSTPQEAPPILGLGFSQPMNLPGINSNPVGLNSTPMGLFKPNENSIAFNPLSLPSLNNHHKQESSDEEADDDNSDME